MFFLLLLILPEVRTQAPVQPNYSPRPYQLPFNAVQFVQHKQAKKGPILFPNDAPPPPPTPLIVTSRPLSESIARSELNPNNSLAAQSQYHQVTYRPNYLARGKNYEPYSYALVTVAPPAFGYESARTIQGRKENFYNDYEKRLMDFVHPRNHEGQPIQHKGFKQPNKGTIVKKLNKDDKEKKLKLLHTSQKNKNTPNNDNVGNDYENEFNEEDNNFDFDFNKLHLRVAKPLYEFGNLQKQQNTAPKVEHYKYKESPEQYYSKNNGDDHDYSKENNKGDDYAFSYTVKDHKTGDDFSHSQKSKGSATNGEYRVLLPDGRMQIVSYTADENGYKADVRYDEHHNQDHGIDFRNGIDKQIQNNEVPNAYKHDYVQNEHVDHQDSFENEEILQRPLSPIPTSYKSILPNNYEKKHYTNDYRNKNYNFQYNNVYPTKSAYVDTTGANIDDRTFDGLSDNNNDYLENYNTQLEGKEKGDRVKDDYNFSEEGDYSKEIVDYSSDIDQAYQPHKSKYSAFQNNQNTRVQTQLRPSYDELKDLFVGNVNSRRNGALPVVSTVRPVYAVTPENVVAITPKKPISLYTNIQNIVSATPTSFLFSTPSPSTPRSYLLSTIANLKHQISLANKPVLSDHYINKINKYLSYTDPSKINK